MAATQQQLDEVSGRILRQRKQLANGQVALGNKLQVMASMVEDGSVSLARLTEVWQDVQQSANEYAATRTSLEADELAWLGATATDWTAE